MLVGSTACSLYNGSQRVRLSLSLGTDRPNDYMRACVIRGQVVFHYRYILSMGFCWNGCLPEFVFIDIEWG